MTITTDTVDDAFSYEEYRELIDELLKQVKTTGMIQTEKHVEYTKLNRQRMNRIEKTTEILPDLKDESDKLKRKLIWLVITEAWCGDAANIVPVLHKIAQGSPMIDMKLILRDDNPEIMDNYLTNGNRSIPILICLNEETLDEIGVWGSRPKALQDYINELKSKPDFNKSELRKNIQMWYFKDKTKEIQREFIRLLEEWNT